MGKSIWDQLGDFAGTIGNDVGGFFNTAGQDIGHLLGIDNQPAQGAPQQQAPTPQPYGAVQAPTNASPFGAATPVTMGQPQNIPSLLQQQQNQQKQGQVTAGRPKTAGVTPGQQLNPTDLQSDLQNIDSFQPQDQVNVLQHAIHAGALDQNQGLSAINGILDGQAATANQPKSSGNMVIDAGKGLLDMAGATANTFGDMGVSAYAALTGNDQLARDTNAKAQQDFSTSPLGFVTDTAKTVGNAISSGVTAANDNASGKDAQQAQDITNEHDAAMTAYQNARNATTQDDYTYWARQYQAHSAVYDTLTQQRQSNLDQEQSDLDPVKVMGAGANAALNLATLGTEGTIAKMTGSVADKTGLTETGAKALISMIAGPTIGGALGITGTASSEGLNAKPSDYLNNAGTAAVGGGLLAAGTHGVSARVETARLSKLTDAHTTLMDSNPLYQSLNAKLGQLRDGIVQGQQQGLSADQLHPLISEMSDTTGQMVDMLHRTAFPKRQGGFVQLPGHNGLETPEAGDQPSDPLVSQYINEQVASHGSPQEFEDNLVKQLWEQNKKGKGVQTTLVNGDPTSNDYTGRVSISNNSQFYQDYYAAHGHAPTLKGIRDIVHQELTGEKGDYTNVLDSRNEYGDAPFAHDIYQELARRDAATAHATPPEEAPVQPTKTVRVRSPQTQDGSIKVGSGQMPIGAKATSHAYPDVTFNDATDAQTAVRQTRDALVSHYQEQLKNDESAGDIPAAMKTKKALTAQAEDEMRTNPAYAKLMQAAQNEVDDLNKPKQQLREALNSPEYQQKTKIGQQLAAAKEELKQHQAFMKTTEKQERGKPVTREVADAALARKLKQTTLQNEIRNLAHQYDEATKAYQAAHPETPLPQKGKLKITSQRQKALNAEQEQYLSQPQNEYHMDGTEPAPEPQNRTSEPSQATDDNYAATFGASKSEDDTNFSQREEETGRSQQTQEEKTDAQKRLDGETAVFGALREGKTVAQAAKLYREHTGVTKDEALTIANRVAEHVDIMNGKGSLSHSNPLMEHYEKIFGNPETTDEGARLKAQAMHDELTERANTALKLGKELSNHDKLLLDQMEEGKSDEEIAKQAENPERVKQTLQAMRDYYDTEHALAFLSGDRRLYRQNYLAHIYSHELDDPTLEAGGLNQDSLHQEARVFGTYKEAAAHGFQAKYQNVLQDLLHHHLGSVNRIRANSFFNDMATLHPDQLSRTSAQVGGREFIQNELFGNQGRKIYLHPDLAAEVNHFAQPVRTIASTKLAKTVSNIAQGYDTLNRAAKNVLLSGGGFHLLNTGMYAMTHPLAFMEHVLGTDERYARTTSERRLAGLTSDSQHLNADFRSGGEKATQYDRMIQQATDKATGGQKAVTIAKGAANITHTLTFDVGIKHFKESIFDRATQGLDFSKPADLAEARRIAATVNDFFGGINRLMDGTISPRVFKILTRTVLAPDFMEGQFRALGRSAVGTGKLLIGQSDRADRLAVQTMVGRLVLVSGAVTLTNALVNPEHRNITPQEVFGDFLNNLLDPEIQTGIKAKKDGPYKSIALPATALNIIARAGEPFVNGDPDPFSGIKHELTARTSAGGRLLTELGTNQDYYGNPLWGHDVGGNPISPVRAAENVAGQFLPIPVTSAASTTKGGNAPVDPVQTGISILGGRLHNDPTDPQTMKTNQYYATTNRAYNELGVNSQAAYRVMNPQQKDADGNYIRVPTIFDSPEKATTALAEMGQKEPNAFTASVKVNQELAKEGQNVDPFWTQLTPDQQKAVLEKQTMPMGGPDEQNWMNQNASWYKPFETQRSIFFDSLPKGGDPNGPQKPQLPDDLQAPKQTPDIQAGFTQLDSITTPQDRAKFLDANPNLQNYMDQYAQYVNNVREARGYADLRTYPKPDADTKQFMDTYFAADKATRAAMRNSQPDLYTKFQNYTAQADRYNLDKAAGLDELVNPGQDQNAQPDQKYLKSVYNMGQYDIAKPSAAGGSYSLSPQEAFQQRGSATTGHYVRVRKSYGSGGFSSSFLRHASQVNRQIAKDYQRPHTPSQLKRLSRVVTVGVHQPKIKGSLRVRYRKLNI